MRSLSLALGIAALACLLTSSSVRAAEAPPELKKLRILLVFDNDDRLLKHSLNLDIARLKRFIRENIPVERQTLEIFTGKQVTRDSILSYYRNLKTDDSEGLLFFYGGHGAIEKTSRQHFFELTNGKNKILFRHEVRKAMEARKASLNIILSDCCSNIKKLKKDLRAAPPPETTSRSPERMRAVIRCLFFQARGTVDVTAATDDFAWSDNMEGGIFTRAICRNLMKPLPQLDTNKDKFLTWEEFFPQLRSDTETYFKTWTADMVGRGEDDSLKSEKPQKPTAFLLGNLYAAFGIANLTKKPLEYSYRWSEDNEWEKVELKPGERKSHFVKVDPEARTLPAPQARFGGISRPQTLKVNRWTGQNEPEFRDSFQYRIRPRPGSE